MKTIRFKIKTTITGKTFNPELPLVEIKSKNRVLFILDKMDEDEVKQDTLLVGNQGKLLTNLVNLAKDSYIKDKKDLNFSWSCINFVNAKIGKNSSEQYAYFVERIVAYTKQFEPTSIICLSPRFLRYFYPEKFGTYQTYGKYLGSFIEHKGLRVFPCIDILPLLYDKTENGVSGSLEIVANILSNGICGRIQYAISAERIKNADIKLVDTIEKFKILMGRLRKQKVVSVDTETDSLNKVCVKLLTIQFAYTLDEAYILPIFHKDSTFNAKELKYIFKDLKNFFEGDNKISWFVYQNGNFDLNVLRSNIKIDFFPNRIWDTIAGEYALSENWKFINSSPGIDVKPFSLEAICTRRGFYEYGVSTITKDDSKNIQNKNLSDSLVKKYMGYDALVILDLCALQIEQANDMGYTKYVSIVSEQISDMIHCFSDMNQNGLPVDIDYLMYLNSRQSPILIVLKDMLDEIYAFKEAKELNKKLVKEAHIPSSGLFGTVNTWMLDLKKRVHKTRFFFEELGLKPVNMGADGVTGKIDKLFQSRYSDHPAIKAFSALSKAEKLRDSYVKSFIKKLKQDADFKHDFCIRPNFNFSHIITGRIAERDPNCQQIPSHSELGKHIKRLFTAQQGEIIIKVDYSAHEVRGLALISNDSVLAEVFEVGLKLRELFRRKPSKELAGEIELKGDVHKLNCIAEGTLIATENGLIPIEDLSTINKTPLVVGNKKDPSMAVKWIDKGVRKTLKVCTKLGNTLQVTPEHKLLTFNENAGKLIWVNAEDCTPGTLLVINPKQPLRSSTLELSFTKTTLKSDIKYQGTRMLKEVTTPKYMSPDLAQLLAYIIAEACISKTKNGFQVIFSNNNLKILEKYSELMSSIFGIAVKMKMIAKSGKDHEICGVNTKYSSNLYQIVVSSKQLVNYLEQLGVYTQEGRREGKVPSHFLVVPWSILQADSISQLRFLAAYLDTDGCTSGNTIFWCSASYTLLSQLQVLLNSFGFVPKIVRERTCGKLILSALESRMLWPKIEKYVYSKSFDINCLKTKSNEGIPVTFWKSLLLKRRESTTKDNKVTRFKNDENTTITLDSWNNYFLKIKNISKYNSWEGLTSFLSNLKLISKKAHKRLRILLRRGYVLTPVVSNELDGKTRVFDLVMAPSADPSFIANGLVVHNCTFFFNTNLSTVAKDVLKQLRNQIKGVVFGLIYGKGNRALSKDLNKDIEFVDKLVKNFFKRFKRGGQWLINIEKLAQKHFYVESPLGRRRNLSSYLLPRTAETAERLYAAMNRRARNSPIQGMCSDFGFIGVRRILWRAWERSKEVGERVLRVCNVVHDSTEALAKYKHIMFGIKTIHTELTKGVEEEVLKRHNFKFCIGLEIDIELGASLNSCQVWNGEAKELFRIIAETLAFQKYKLGYDIPIGAILEHCLTKQRKDMPDYLQYQLKSTKIDLDTIRKTAVKKIKESSDK